MAMAYNGFVALGKETTWGTPVARTDFLRFLSFDFQHNPGVMPLENSQNRYTNGAVFANYQLGFSGRFEARVGALGPFFRSMFSVDPVTTTPVGATLARLHTFTPSPEGNTPVLKPYTLEARYGTANVSDVGSGGIVNELTIAWDNNMVAADVSGVCKKPQTAAPTALGTYTPDRPLMYHNLAITPDTFFGNGTDPKGVRSGSIQFVDEAAVNFNSQDRFMEKPERGRLRANLQFTMTFEDHRDMKRFWDDAGVDTEPTDTDAPERAINLTWTGAEIESGHNYEMGFDFTKVIMQPPQKPQTAGEQIIQTVGLTASYDSSLNRLFQAHLKNTVTAY